MKEMEEFEKLMLEVTEYKETYNDDSNDIIRPESGELFKFTDIC